MQGHLRIAGEPGIAVPAWPVGLKPRGACSVVDPDDFSWPANPIAELSRWHFRYSLHVQNVVELRWVHWNRISGPSHPLIGERSRAVEMGISGTPPAPPLTKEGEGLRAVEEGDIRTPPDPPLSREGELAGRRNGGVGRGGGDPSPAAMGRSARPRSGGFDLDPAVALELLACELLSDPGH